MDEAGLLVEVHGGGALRVGQQEEFADRHLAGALEHAVQKEFAGLQAAGGGTHTHLGELEATAVDRHQRAGADDAEGAGFDKQNLAAPVEDHRFRILDDLEVVGFQREHVFHPFAGDRVELRREALVIFHEAEWRQAAGGGHAVLDAQVQRAGLEAFFEPRDLRQDVRIRTIAEGLRGAAHVGPHAVLHVVDQRFAFRGQADLLLAVVALDGDGAGEAEGLQAVVDAGDGGLADADGFDRLRDGHRAIGRERGEQGEMRRLNRDAAICKRPGGVRLHTLGEAFQPAAKGEIAHLRQNIARHTVPSFDRLLHNMLYTLGVKAGRAGMSLRVRLARRRGRAAVWPCASARGRRSRPAA